MSGILAMLNYVLPQALILAGLAGMIVLAVRRIRLSRFIGNKVHIGESDSAKIGKSIENFRQALRKTTLGALEKTLRRAKIVALKFDNFVSGKLQHIAAIKRSREMAQKTEDFWQHMKRGRMAFMRRKKIAAVEEKPIENIPITNADEPSKKDDEFLRRVASERKSEYTDEGGSGA